MFKVMASKYIGGRQRECGLPLPTYQDAVQRIAGISDALMLLGYSYGPMYGKEYMVSMEKEDDYICLEIKESEA